MASPSGDEGRKILFNNRLRTRLSIFNHTSPDGGIGRRAGLKHQFLFGVPVRPRLRVLNQSESESKNFHSFFDFSMATVYILYSQSINSYYVGSCIDLDERLLQHKKGKYKTSFTTRAEDWEVYLKIENLEYKQARKVETHIKKMKSRTYIQNLVKYPDIITKLKEKYH